MNKHPVLNPCIECKYHVYDYCHLCTKRQSDLIGYCEVTGESILEERIICREARNLFCRDGMYFERKISNTKKLTLFFALSCYALIPMLIDLYDSIKRKIK